MTANRNDITLDETPAPVTPSAFLAEVQQFRNAIADPALSIDEKRQALYAIVARAGRVDPTHVGYEDVGVALKDALMSWLDFRRVPVH